MTSETVTLIAALIAAISSIITLWLNVRSQYSSETRIAQRAVLENFIVELGEAIHETTATSKILLKTKTEEAAKNWRDRSIVAKEKLQSLIPKLRYPLWGITDNLRTFSRLPDWVEHTRKFSESNHGEKICDEGAKLGDVIEICIKNSYISGRVPTRFEILRIQYQTWKFKRAYKKFKDENPKQVD